MGVIYKITAEIITLIVEEKKKNPAISCRKLARIIEQKFDIKISKSSINSLTKDAGLSMPVGRRSKGVKKEIKPAETELSLPAPEESLLLEKEEPPSETKEEAQVIEETTPPVEEKPVAAEPEKGFIKEIPEIAPQEPAKEEASSSEEAVVEESAVGKEKAGEQEKEELVKPEEVLKEEPVVTPETQESLLEKEEVAKEEPIIVESEIEPKPESVPEQESVLADEPVKEEQKEEPRQEIISPVPMEPAPAEAEEPVLPSEETTTPIEPEKLEITEPAHAEEIQEPEPATQEAPEPQEQTPAEEIKAPEKEEAKEALPIEIDNAGLIFLKSADNLMWLTHSIAELIKNSGLSLASDIQEKIEFILYKQITKAAGIPAEYLSVFISAFSGKPRMHEILADSDFLKQIEPLTPDILRLVSSLFREIRCVKLGLSDGNFIYVDPQMRSIWPSPYIPYGFSVSLSGAKRSFSDCFIEDDPVVLFLAPYNDIPIDEMFTLLSSLSARGNKVINFGLYNEALEEVETVHLARTAERDFIIGMFPRQFTEYAKVSPDNNFIDFVSQTQSKKFQVCDGQAELINSNTGSRVSYRACSVKNVDTGRLEFVLLTNIGAAKQGPAQILASYLKMWPDFAATFSDMKAKINLFSIMAENYQPFSLDILSEAKKDSSIIQDINKVFSLYFNSLQAYVKRYFFPVGYENKDPEFMYSNFYSLKAQVREENGLVVIKFLVPQDYIYLSIVRYICSRINENRIILKGKKLFLTV